MGIIEIKNYTKKFGTKTIFENFDLTINQGEMVAVMGPSGSGKTTLLNVIGLIDSLDHGSYLLANETAPRNNTRTANKVIREKISYLFQNFALVDNLTVEENLRMALRYVKKSKKEKEEDMKAALVTVGLADCAKQKVYELSGGEQQRVSMARAIIKPSTVILADEPTGSLDAENRDEIMSIIKYLNKEEGKTIVIVTHDLEIAKRCDRIVKLNLLE